ncbi:MAG TPA: choice-of-anchor D domain-containing protein [Candidatus Acidoferrales bacterium]|nr:choice-of-anchor D domain-containing protein [Candidatus Acidoferrales bacterium]
MSARTPWLAALAAVAALALAPTVARAQTGSPVITTVAGGGPNNIPGLSANLAYPGGMAADQNGNIYVATSDDNRVYKIDTAGTVTIVAGNGTSGYGGDGGPASSAQLNAPEGVAVDGSGNVFIADQYNSVIRRVDGSTHVITTVAGNIDQTLCANPSDSLGDGCAATSASLNDPYDVAVDSAGNLYIADSSNSVIREVFATTGIIQTVAGTAGGQPGYGGDNNPATSAQLNAPQGVRVDGSGNIFIADTSNCIIREVLGPGAGPTAGFIYTVAGNPQVCGFGGDGGAATSETLYNPVALSLDGSGNIFVADSYNSIVREFTVGGNIQTVAGEPENYGYSGDGGSALSAQISNPYGVAVDPAGNIFISDTYNYAVREVLASNANIQTIAGNGFTTFGGDGSPATGATLAQPAGVFVDPSGNVFIADTDNEVVRQVDGAAPHNITTVAGTPLMYAPCDPPATGVDFCFPGSVAVDSAGDLFLADSGDSLIWEVPAGTGQIQVVAGLNDDQGFCNSTPLGDGCPATQAQLSFPEAIYLDSLGNLFIADTDDTVIREVYCITGAAGCTPPAGFQAGYINTVAGIPFSSGGGGDGGPATTAQLAFPTGVAVDSSGNIYIADVGNAVVRVVYCANSAVACAPPAGFQAGYINTVAGSGGLFGYSGDGGPATSAVTTGPYDVKVDSAGNLFFSDCGGGEGGCNQVVREVYCANAALPCTPPAGFNPGDINTVVGDGTEGFAGDGGPAINAELDFPAGLAIDSTGNLYIADYYNNRIRSVGGIAAGAGAAAFAASPNPLAFGSQAQNLPSAPMTLTFSNPGTAALTITGGLTPTGANATDFAETSTGTCGQVPITLGANSTCTVQYTFTPSTLAMESAALMVADNAAGSPQTVNLTGTGIPPTVTFTPNVATGVNFGAVTPGMTSAEKSVTMSVTAGTGDIQISFIETISPDDSNDFAIDFQTSTCPTDGGTVPAGTSCVVNMTFTPSGAGAESGTLLFVGTNLPGGEVEIPLMGFGASTSAGFTVTPSGPGGGTVSILPGDTATFTIIVQPNPGFIGPITVMCAEPATIPNTILTTSPSTTINVTTTPSPPIIVTCTLQTNCNPALAGPRAPWPQVPWTPAPLAGIGGLALVLAVLLRKSALAGRGQRLAPLAAVCLVAVLLLTCAACVNNPPPAIPGAPTTPAGVYQIQVIATAPGIPSQMLGLTVRII